MNERDEIHRLRLAVGGVKRLPLLAQPEPARQIIAQLVEVVDRLAERIDQLERGGNDAEKD